MRSSVSIALFFLLSGLFLSLLLGVIERSRKLLAVAGACVVGVVCIIVFLTPVQLPHLGWGDEDEKNPIEAGNGSTTTVPATTVTTRPVTTSTAGVGTTVPEFSITTSSTAATDWGPIDGKY